jgi:hypothetical protein
MLLVSLFVRRFLGDASCLRLPYSWSFSSSPKTIWRLCSLDLSMKGGLGQWEGMVTMNLVNYSNFDSTNIVPPSCETSVCVM